MPFVRPQSLDLVATPTMMLSFYRLARVCLVVVLVLWSSSCFSLPDAARPVRTARRCQPPGDPPLQTVNEIPEPDRRLVAFQQLMKLEKDVLVLEKDKEFLVLEKDKELLIFENRKFNEDIMRAQGLMTARRVFERVVQLGWNEQLAKRKAKGKCVIANAVPVIAQNQNAGRWSQTLIKAALKCVAGPKPSEKTLQDMWTELSSRVHNDAWAGDVKIADNLSNSTQCIARELCTEMGLRVMGEEE